MIKPGDGSSTTSSQINVVLNWFEELKQKVPTTYVGGKTRIGSQSTRYGARPHDIKSPLHNKAPVVSVLQRGGSVRSYHIERVTAKNIKPILNEMVDQNADLMTDSSTVLKSAGKNRQHSQVNHVPGQAKLDRKGGIDKVEFLAHRRD